MVKDVGDSKVFSVKSEDLRTLPVVDKALKKVSLVLAESWTLESS